MSVFGEAFTALLDAGEYKLAFRSFVIHHKTVRLHHAKLLHDLKWQKLKVESDALSEEARRKFGDL